MTKEIMVDDPIIGFQVDVSGKELQEHLRGKATEHYKKAGLYKEQATGVAQALRLAISARWLVLWNTGTKWHWLR